MQAPVDSPRSLAHQGTWWRRLVHEAGRIRIRLLLVNLVVVLVPVAGLEFARIYERQLLHALERDMANQAALARSLVENDAANGMALGASHQAAVFEQAARRTRTRIRLVDPARGVVADSHAHGAPEGPEPPPPALVHFGDTSRVAAARPPEAPENLLARPELVGAFGGQRSTQTRTAAHPPAVYLFLAEPVRHAGKVIGVVYLVRSTNPVLLELHRIRTGLIWVLAAALSFTALVTLALAWSISRPLERLSRAAKRLAAGERGVVLPRGGGGEISELGESLAIMTDQLDARLHYISDFSADVAHEFKSPLTSIRGAAELLSEGAADDPEARQRFLHNIELDAARLDRLVSRLLELSRIEATSVAATRVDLRALVQRAITRSASPDATIRLTYAREDPYIVARETDLETALLNLLDNALRFSPDGDEVLVEVAEDVERRITISVCDRGRGIDPENLARVFERFFTTEADRDGTGLGLAIVRSVVLAHGGEVRVESTPGSGASFTMVLPGGH